MNKKTIAQNAKNLLTTGRMTPASVFYSPDRKCGCALGFLWYAATGEKATHTPPRRDIIRVLEDNGFTRRECDIIEDFYEVVHRQYCHTRIDASLQIKRMGMSAGERLCYIMDTIIEKEQFESDAETEPMGIEELAYSQ